MKKIMIAIIVFALAFTTSACSSAELPDGFDEEEVISLAKNIVEWLNDSEFESVTAMVREDLQNDLSAETLENALSSALEKAGAFEEFSKAAVTGTQDSSTGEDYAVAVLVCKYENDQQIFTISIDGNLEIVGLYMK